MSRRAALVLAAAIVIAANALLLGSAARNRAGEPETTIELSERELRLPPPDTERTFASLRLDWNGELAFRERDAGFFDRQKLAAVGFQTRLSADDAGADGYYGWQPSREAWVVLELDGPAAARWRERRRHALEATLRKLGGPEEGRVDEARRAATEACQSELASRSRLFPIDVGTDAAALRVLHPDRTRHLIVRAIVRAERFSPWDPETRTHGPAFVRGRIERLLVEEIQVPREKRAHLDELLTRDRKAERASPSGAGAEERLSGDAPRYGVVLRYGGRHTPWVEEVRPLAAR